MRKRTTAQRVCRKRRFLLALLAGLSASGCASSPNRIQPTAYQIASKPSATSSQAVRERAASEQAAKLAGRTKPLSPPVQPVSFNNDVVNLAPEFEPQELEQDVASSPGQGGEAVIGNEGPRDGEDQAARVSSASAPIDPLQMHTETATGTQQPVEYFVAVALAGHPKIQAARQRVAAAANVAPQVRALPDPMFNNTFWPIHDQALQTAGGRVGHQFGLSQGVPWPEKLRTKAAIANREAQMAQAEVERIEREITESVRLAYYEVWFTTRAIAIIEETRALVDDLTQVAEARYRSGGSQQDVLRAQLEGDRLDDQMVTLRKQKQQAQADLAAIVQRPLSLIPEASPELGLADVPEQLDVLLGLAEQCSPELRAIAWEIQRDRQKQKLACLQKYPDLQVGLNYAIISDDRNVISPVANGHDNISFTLGTTLPIWRDKIDAGIREAAHRTTSSAQRLEAERDAIYGKLRRLLAQADALVEQQTIYNERIIPRTEDTLKLTIADYRGKRADFFALIETYRELLMFQTQQARIEATLAGTLAQIERTVGCPTN